MKLKLHTAILPWYNKQHWGLRFIIPICAVYPLTIFGSIAAGTFLPGGDVPCNIPIVQDTVFHLIWLLAIPFSLALLRQYHEQRDAMLDALSRPACRVFDDNATEVRASLACGMLPLVLLIVALVIRAAFLAVNLRETGETQSFWWFTYGHLNVAAGAYVLVSFLATWIGLIILSRYFQTMWHIRERMSDLRVVPPSITGHVWKVQKAFLIMTLPLLLIPSAIWASRIKLGYGFLAPITIFNMVSLPVGIIAVLFLPWMITKIRFRLARQRNTLLNRNNTEISRLLEKMARRYGKRVTRVLTAQIDELSKEKAFIQKHYLVWPIAGTRAILVGAVSLIPAVLPVLDQVVSFAKSLLEKVGT